MGEHQRLRETRLFLLYALEDQFRAIVEQTLGRKTVAFVSGIDTTRDVTIKLFTLEPVDAGRTRARFRLTPAPGHSVPRWCCVSIKVMHECAPTVWGLPRARVTETQCAAAGADSCRFEVRWRTSVSG